MAGILLLGTSSGGGGGGGTGTAPVLTWTTGPTDMTPDGTMTFANRPVAGDTVTSQIQTAGGNWSSLALNTVHVVTAAEDYANEIDLANALLPPGTYDWRVKTTHLGVDTPWSNVVTKLLTGFNPGMLAPELWFEPARALALGTLFSNNNGTVPAIANGNSVAAMPDHSANARTLTSILTGTSPADAPLLQGVGAFPYLAFDGVNDALQRAVDIGAPAGGFTWAIALRSASNAAGSYVMSQASTTTSAILGNLTAHSSIPTSSSGFWRNDASSFISGGMAGTNYANPNVFDGTDKVFVITCDLANVRTYVNGGAVATGGVGALGTMTFNRFALGSLVRASNANFWAGRIYGAVAVNSVLSAGDRNDLTTYLGNLAGLSL